MSLKNVFLINYFKTFMNPVCAGKFLPCVWDGAP